MKVRTLSMIAIPCLLFATLGSAEEPARGETDGPESEAASEEEGAPSGTAEDGMAEEILITLQVPLFSPLFASTPLASVEDEPITMEELTRSIASSHARRTDAETPVRKDFANLLDRLLTTKLIIQEARNIGLDELPAVAARIDNFATELLVHNLMSRELESVEADPADVDRLYSRMSREFLLTTIQFEKEEDALAFEEQYAAEGDFTQLAMRFFEEGKATGELGSEEYVKLKDLFPEVAQTADSLEVGAVSQIFRASNGLLVFYVRDIRVYEDPGLREEARRRIIERLRRERAEEYADSLERKYATIDYDLLAEVSFMPRKTGLPFFRREVPVDHAKLLSDDRVLATVHSEEPLVITVGDLARKVGRSFYHGVDKGVEGRKDADRRKLVMLKNMVFEKTGPMEARHQGLDREKEYLDAVEQKTASLLFGVFVRKVIAPDVTIREEEVRQYYEDHLDDFSTPKMVRLNGLVFDELPDAKRALDKLSRGADFRWVSANTPGQLDEDTAKPLDFDNVLLSVNSLPEGLRQAAQGARRGDPLLYSGPDELYYVVVVSRVFPPQPQAYPEAREEIAELITVEKVKDLVVDWGVKLREAYEPRIFLQGLPE
jgi:hypothetical protein